MGNLLRVCYPFVGDTVGGSHISALALIQGLPRDAVCPVVVVHKEGPLTEYLQSLSLSFLRAPKIRVVKAGRFPMEIAEILRCAVSLGCFVHRQRIDIVHTNDRRMHLTWGLAARLAGARFIWHQRSATKSRRLDVYSWPANRVLTISRFCWDMLSPRTKKRAEVITNPFQSGNMSCNRAIDKSRFLQALGMPPDTTVIGYVGNLVSQKRPQVFVEMAANLCKLAGRPLIFPMFGEPREPMRSQVEELVQRMGLQSRCVVMGARFPIEPWIASCDILVAPAVSEGFGRTLVEAMLVGTPVVASADGGHLEIVQDGRTGVLVEPDNPGAFADAVIRLIDDAELRRSITVAAYRTATDTYSVDRHVDAVLSVYREVLRKPERLSARL